MASQVNPPMSVFSLRPSAQLTTTHPAVVDRRIRELVLLGAAALAAVAIALAVAISVRQPRLIVALALIAGATAVIALMLNPRLELSVALLGLYLGLLDGPVRLGLGGAGGSEGVSAARDVLILAVALGAILRMAAKKEKLRLPPLSGWVLAFALLVLVEAFNPKTAGVLKSLGGFRQQLEWVPFFFFGYALMRSKDRFRKFFLILGVITLANGIVATYQTQISPAQLASWGPGYKSRLEGSLKEGAERSGRVVVKTGARKYVHEGEAFVRPMALGSDSGRSGGLGVIALPCALALLAIAPLRKRWVGVLLCLGALVGIAASLGRLQVVGSLLAVLAFIGLAIIAGRKVSRPIAALLGVACLAIPLGVGFLTVARSGAFSRYETLASLSPGSCSDCKRGDLSLIPHQLSVAPFGVGLGTVGAASGFGGRTTDLIDGHGVSAETQYNFLADELGVAGLILWPAFVLTLILLAVRRLRRIADGELRILLAGLCAPLIAIVLMGFSGPISTSGALGPYLWFTAGVCAYWFAGPVRADTREGGVVAP
jgi:hypothetical protein